MIAPSLSESVGSGRWSGLTAVGRSIRRAFGYEGAEEQSRQRRYPSSAIRHEDAELDPTRRQAIISRARDQKRNSNLASWALRKHLDYVAEFEFQVKTGSKSLDQQIERWWQRWSDPENCDVTARFDFRDLVRQLEAARTLDGDVGLLFLRDGRLQPIEGDRIRTVIGDVPGYPGVRWSHGVQTDDFGRPLRYAIYRRWQPSDLSPGNWGWTFERVVSAADMHLHAYWPRVDSNRGVSPLTPAINDLIDLGEAKSYALAKMKVAQLFGLALYRGGSEALGPATVADDDADALKVDFSRGPYQLDLDAGDKAEILESSSPSDQFQSWFTQVTASALKALDIPYSFYAENFTNFSGQRQAWLQYNHSARVKRRSVTRLLDKVAAWRLTMAIAAGELPAFDVASKPWLWIPTGVPWIDPLAEVQATTAALQAQITSRTRVVAAQGEDWDEIVADLARENAALQSAGLNTAIAYQPPNNDPRAAPPPQPTADPNA